MTARSLLPNRSGRCTKLTKKYRLLWKTHHALMACHFKSCVSKWSQIGKRQQRKSPFEYMKTGWPIWLPFRKIVKLFPTWWVIPANCERFSPWKFYCLWHQICSTGLPMILGVKVVYIFICTQILFSNITSQFKTCYCYHCCFAFMKVWQNNSYIKMN